MSSILPHGLDTLRFFTGNGAEIQMRKQFSLEWEIIPADQVYRAFYRNPKGHVEAGRPESLNAYFDELQPGVFETTYITPEDATTYTYVVKDVHSKAIMTLSAKEQQIQVIQEVWMDDDADEATVVIYKNAEGDVVMQPISGCHLKIISTMFKGGNFRCFAGSAGHDLSGRSLKAMIVVDEPGLIAPNAKFYRLTPSDADYIRDYTLIQSKDGVVSTDNKDCWRRIDSEEQLYTIDNVYDIIFFGYKSEDADGNVDYRSNRLLLTVNDGTDIVTEEYNLSDIFRGTVETCKEENLIECTSFEITDNGFFAETAEELLHIETGTSLIYGICDGLLAQVRMKEYEQYDEDLLDSITSFISRVRAKQYAYSDQKILATLMSTFKKYDFETDQWNSEQIIGIVRHATGQYVTVAKELLDYFIYAEGRQAVNHETVMRYVLQYNVPETQYPYVRYVGIVNQERVSADFVLPETIVLVNKEDNEYKYPSVTDGNEQYRLFFRFQDDTEMFFLKMDDNMNMERLHTLVSMLPSEINLLDNIRTTNALHFATGFQASREGCYKNIMGMFMRNETTEEDFFIGAIEFRTTVIGEDERYRTLLENFGIPDPKIYPNIFREQDPDEQGIDWKLVNRKSKEMMLSYDSIFPYSGTYRALFRAVKYLGYTDVIFKEWYKIIDKNEESRYVAVQNFDVSTGISLRNVLKAYGIEYGQYQRYNKLNRLSMVYHLQEIDDHCEEQLPIYGYVFTVAGQRVCIPVADEPVKLTDYAENPEAFGKEWDDPEHPENALRCFIHEDNDKQYVRVVSTLGGSWYLSKYSTLEKPIVKAATSVAVTAEFGEYAPRMVHGTDSDGNRVTWEDLSSEVPAIKNIYEYRNDELLAKLYQVKEWLERYVTGVGCYISDINGESVVLERIKNEAYITGGEVKDMTTVGKFTPHAAVKEGSVFTDSSICITCGLNEFRSLSFEDYADFPIERFVKWSYDTDGNEIPMTANVTVGRSKQEMPVYISAPLSALTVADEFRYTLELNHPNSGSLYEFADASCLDNPIVVADGEITLFNTKKKSSSITNSPTDKNASNECPVIEISKGNIREVYGDWAPDSSDNNIAWSIMSGYADDGNLYVTLSSQSPDYLYETTDTEMHNKYPEYDATHIYPEFKFKGSVLLTPERNAKLEYTSVNKWGVPMIIVSGYYPSNQMPGDYVGHRDFRAARPDYFPRERKFILEIFEGTMKFRNHHDAKQLKHCIGADVIFGDATVEEGEQPVFINFKWQSDRIPVYEVQTTELLNKLNTTQFNDFQEVQDCMSDYLKTNTEVDVPVNRLGDYWVSIQAYDAYNNIYANRGDDIINVQSDMPDIEILVNQEDSNNTLDFFVGNATYDPSVEDERVHLLTPDEIDDASAAIKTIPEFPKEYRIYSATHETSTNVIVYDNISYALDTPKEGDRLILTNMTESAYSVTKTSNYVHIGMNSGNPRKQQIYNAGGTVTLCVWDENTKTILAETEDVSVQRCVYPTEEEQESVFYENGSIEVAVSDWNNSDVSPYIDNINDHDSGVELYVIDTTEIDVTKYIDYVVNDTSTNDGSTYFNMAFVPVDEKDADNFNEDTMVKMRVEFTDKEQNCKMFVNEAAFRVLKKDIRHTETADKETTEYGYWLLGRINTDFFDKLRQRNIFMYDKDLTDELNENAKAENKQMAYSIDNLRITLRPLHSSAVEYELRVTEDADETLYVYNDFKFYGQKTEVKYDDGQLMFGAYLDDLYSARVMRYDPEDLISIWNTDMIEGDVYNYRNYPVTVEPGRKVIICSDKDVPQLADGWKVLWKWKTYVIEDMSNLQNMKPQDMNKILLFESINDVISVKPQLLGSQFIELYLTDVYGNVIANKGGGNLMVQNYDDEDEVTLL